MDDFTNWAKGGFESGGGLRQTQLDFMWKQGDVERVDRHQNSGRQGSQQVIVMRLQATITPLVRCINPADSDCVVAHNLPLLDSALKIKIKREEFFLFTDDSVCRAKMVHRMQDGNFYSSLFRTPAYDVIFEDRVVGGVVFTWKGTLEIQYLEETFTLPHGVYNFSNHDLEWRIHILPKRHVVVSAESETVLIVAIFMGLLSGRHDWY